MIRYDARFRETVETAVRRIERATSAEIVVVASSRSGSYRDLAAIAGAGAAWLSLAVLVYSPFVFLPTWMAIEVGALGLGAGWLAHRSPWLLRLLAGPARTKRQVETAAKAAFMDESVHGTRGRTGILVYASLLEERVVLIPDAGLAAKVPGGAWNALRFGPGPDPARLASLDGFLAGLDSLGAILAREFPAPADDRNELPDTPRIQP